MLHFGDGIQALHYFILCFVSLLGTIQLSAAHYKRQDLLWLNARRSLFLGAIMIGASFIWFFLVDEEIFVPGLAGGEILATFVAACVAAVPTTRIIAFLATRTRLVIANPRIKPMVATWVASSTQKDD